ncbi:MAG: O-antigen translocase [Dysgonomonas sp.]
MTKKNASYNQIVKSTGIFGGSQIVNMLIGFVRTKIIALLLGTTGVGLIGIYQSVVDMIRSVTCLGLDTVGTREVAATNSLDDKRALEDIVAVIRWWIKTTACLGAAVCIIFCYPISIWAFETADYALPIALLSFCVFFTILNIGQTILLQGMRQITDMVKANILSNFAGLLICIPVYFIFGLKGIALSLVITSIVTFSITYFFSRKLDLKSVTISWRYAFPKGKRMIRLGFFIVLAGVCNPVCMFLIRTFISSNIDLDAAGLFNAVWTITNIYLMLILRSMGSDFYPRLCSIINKNAATRKLVNEQTYIVLIIAAPIIVGMLLLAKPSLILLYTPSFTPAATLLQWQILGTFLKVLSWPMGFVLLAKAKGVWFFVSEVLFFAAYLACAYVLFPFFGLDAAGIGYLMAYVIYLACMFFMAYRLCRFKWRKDVIIMASANLILILLTFLIMQKVDGIRAYICASVIFVFAGIVSIIKFNKVVSIRSVLNKLKRK